MGQQISQEKVKDFAKTNYLYAIALLVSYKTMKTCYRKHQMQNTVKMGKLRRQQRDSKVYQFEQIQEEKVMRILGSNIEQIRDMLLKGETTSEELVNIYAQRCYTIGRKLNLVAEEFYEEGIQMAKQRDLERQQAREQNKLEDLGLLHGIPISIKDVIQEKGKINTIGLDFMANHVGEYNANVVTCILKEGAVPIVRGNVPQLLLSQHTVNRIYGEAKNPHNNSRSCAGSSGGDAAMVASKCIPLSISTDIGGSIRAPSSFNGVFGFKPTPQRVSQHGKIMPTPQEGCPQTPIMSTIGPISNSVEGIKYLMQTLWKQDYLDMDPEQVPIPFNTQLYDHTIQKKSLKIGYIQEYPMLPCSYSYKRTMAMVKEKLEAQGHEVVEVKISLEENLEFVELFMGGFSYGQMHAIYEMFEKYSETPNFNFVNMFFFYRQNKWMHRFWTWWVEKRMGFRFALGPKYFRRYTPFEIDDILGRSLQFQNMFLQKWKDLQLDAIISPGQFHCAFKIEDAKVCSGFFYYHVLWNVLHYPVGVVPVSEVLEGEDTKDYSDNYNDLLTKCIKNSQKGSVGMPLCLQVSTLKFQDEKCLAIMKVINDIIPYKKEINF